MRRIPPQRETVRRRLQHQNTQDMHLSEDRWRQVSANVSASISVWSTVGTPLRGFADLLSLQMEICLFELEFEYLQFEQIWIQCEVNFVKL